MTSTINVNVSPEMSLKGFRNLAREILCVRSCDAIMLLVGVKCCRSMTKTLLQSNKVDGAVVLVVTIGGSLGAQDVLDLVPEAVDAIESATRLLRGDVVWCQRCEVAASLLQEETLPSAWCAAAVHVEIQSWCDVLSFDANTRHGEAAIKIRLAAKTVRDI